MCVYIPSTSPMPSSPGRNLWSAVSPTYMRLFIVSMWSAWVASVPVIHTEEFASDNKQLILDKQHTQKEGSPLGENIQCVQKQKLNPGGHARPNWQIFSRIHRILCVYGSHYIVLRRWKFLYVSTNISFL